MTTVRMPAQIAIDRYTGRSVPGWEASVSLLDFSADRLGPAAVADPTVLEVGPRYARKATITVTEYKRGWTIIGEPTDHEHERDGRFTAIIHRCLIEHCPSQAQYTPSQAATNTCLGHRDHVLALAKRVLNTYRAG